MLAPLLSFQDTGGRMECWQRYTEWARKSLIMTRNAYGYPLRVTEIDGKEFEVGRSQRRRDGRGRLRRVAHHRE